MSFNIERNDKKRVVIIGGGFGGLRVAQGLRKSNFQVILVDKNNYHQFPPLIYQIATAGLNPSSISFPFSTTQYFLDAGTGSGQVWEPN